MALKLSRRSFVKAGAIASASAMVLGTVESSFADEATGQDGAADDVQVIPSACRQCYGRCALFGTVENGRLTKIEGNPDLTVPEGLVFNSHGDHRLAMTWALVGACGSVPVDVTDFTCVAVSYPDFLADLKELVR